MEKSQNTVMRSVARRHPPTTPNMTTLTLPSVCWFGVGFGVAVGVRVLEHYVL